MEDIRNKIVITMDAIASNESFARLAVAAAATPLDPTVEELADIKTAVSEAVTNAIIHGYPQEEKGTVELTLIRREHTLEVTVRDEGVGIADIRQAMQPMFTTRPDLERSGMGFDFMQMFMDTLDVESVPGEGTSVHMSRYIGGKDSRYTKTQTQEKEARKDIYGSDLSVDRTGTQRR
jgi:stage II sporulation protein AB (anti-sigma F factor)